MLKKSAHYSRHTTVYEDVKQLTAAQISAHAGKLAAIRMSSVVELNLQRETPPLMHSPKYNLSIKHTHGTKIEQL